MSFKHDVTSFERTVAGGLGRLDRFLKLSDARERRALAGRVSVSYTRKGLPHSQIHSLLTQILRAAANPQDRHQLSALATKLRRCDCHGKGADYLRAVADLAAATAKLDQRTNKYSPDQPRDPDTGQWVDAGGSVAEAPTRAVSGIKDVVSGALSGASEKLASGARTVYNAVNEGLTNPSATTMVAESLILATVVAFFFYFQRSATAMQMGLAAVDLGLKALRFLALRRVA